VYEASGLFVHHLEGESEDRRLVENATATTWLNLVSPNGKWIAYSANETGQEEIYVTAFPNPSRRWPVSRGGGVRPRWSADGTELYYVGADGRLFVVTEETFHPGETFPLFDLQGASHYDVAPDRQRFLVNVPLPEPPELNVVMDWKTALPQ